jgi:hypothetical protein
MPLEFFLTGDLKFLLDWCGVHSKKHFCLLCDVHCDDRNKCFKLVETQAGDTIRNLAKGENRFDKMLDIIDKIPHFTKILIHHFFRGKGSGMGVAADQRLGSIN